MVRFVAVIRDTAGRMRIHRILLVVTGGAILKWRALSESIQSGKPVAVITSASGTDHVVIVVNTKATTTIVDLFADLKVEFVVTILFSISFIVIRNIA